MPSVQSRVAPPVPVNRSQELSAGQVEDPREQVAGSSKNKTDFRTLITNSMDEVMKERKAKENGDLSASTDAEFLQKLADQTKEKRVPKNDLGKDDFLKLFVTQLQNQNPLNPEADTEMAAKLAQFNGLEQMLNVNKSLEKMLKEQGMDRNLQLVNYVGRDVTVEGGRIRLKDGAPTLTEYNLENPATQSTLEIRNSSGILVHQADLGPSDAGVHTIKWDGKLPDGRTMPDGTYTLAMTARNADGKPVPVSLSSKVRVTGVDVNNKDGGLYSDFGKIKLDQIKSVGLPNYDQNMVEAPSNKTTSGSAAEELERLKAEGKLSLGGKPMDAAADNPELMKALASMMPTEGGAQAEALAKNPAASAALAQMNATASNPLIAPAAPAGTSPIAGLAQASSGAKENLKAPAQAQKPKSADPSPVAKKSIDQQRTSSAKLNQDNSEKSPQSLSSVAQGQQRAATASP